MRDVLDQLESYQTYLDSRYPAVTAEDVLEPHTAADRVPLPIEERVKARRSRSGLPAWVAAGVAAVLVLVAVGVPILLFGGGDSVVTVAASTTVPPTVTTRPPTTVAPVATTVPAATVVPVVPATPMTWERIDDPVVFGGDGVIRLMTDIAVRDGVAVAVGADGDGVFFDAAVWYSTDGVTWNRVPHDEAVFGGDGHQRMNSVVALESGFLAVGSDGDVPGAPGPTFPDVYQSDPSDTSAAVWQSNDGISWVRVPHVDAFSEADGGAVMNDVTLGESGLVAVGLVYGQTEPFATYRWGEEDPSEPREIALDVDAAVWRSSDGVSWSRVRAEDETFGGDTVRQSMNAVTAGGPGFVAVGQEGFDILGFDEWTPIPGNNTDGRDHVTDNVAAVWTSPDGEIWTRVTTEASMAHSGGAATGWATMFDVAAHPQGLVAVGRDVWLTGDSRRSVRVHEGAAVWLSSDGVSWRRAADVDVSEWPDMHAVTASGDGALVAGGGMHLYERAGTWTSRDNGDTWVGHPNEDDLFSNGTIQGISVFGDTVLAVGSLDDDASVWVGAIRNTDG